MTAFGATTTSSLIAGKVCFQEAAKPTSTADMRRIADRQLWGQEQYVLLRPGKSDSGPSTYKIRCRDLTL